ncbi:MAG: DinB/UmuC family translesion DNA polymerase, partial [Planctomycetota bacterium]
QRMLEQSCADLRKEGLLARTMSIKVRHADFTTETRDATLARPSDHDLEWWELARTLLERSLQRRTLVRLLGVRFTGLQRGFWQGGLFEEERVVQRGRLAVLDRMRAKYGEEAVCAGDRLWLDNSR